MKYDILQYNISHFDLSKDSAKKLTVIWNEGFLLQSSKA